MRWWFAHASGTRRFVLAEGTTVLKIVSGLQKRRRFFSSERTVFTEFLIIKNPLVCWCYQTKVVTVQFIAKSKLAFGLLLTIEQT